MAVSSSADLMIRGRHGRQRATICWPDTAPTPPTVLVCFARSWLDTGASPTLPGAPPWPPPGTVAVRVHHRESHDGGDAVADAATAVEWVAEHAAELGADASQVLVMGEGEAAAVVDEVVRGARDRGWPVYLWQVTAP